MGRLRRPSPGSPGNLWGFPRPSPVFLEKETWVLSLVTQHSGAARATCPHSPPPPDCRDRGLQGEIYSGKLTPHHHPTAAIPIPNCPGVGTGIGDLPVTSRHTHLIPSQKLSKQSPQMISPLPSTHRLLGLAVWLVWAIRRLGDSRGSIHPCPPNSHREEEQGEGGRESITAISTPAPPGIPGAQAWSAKARGEGSIANCLYSV